MHLTAKELSGYLSGVYSKASWLDKIKIVYRPYICPFGSLIEECSNSGSIADIGCGSGQFLLLLTKFTGAGKVGGVEISPVLVHNARELLSNQNKASFKIEMYDGINIPGFISEFDTITLIDVFHHIKKEKQEKFILELFSKMKMGSKLVFKDINAAHPFVIMNKIHDIAFGGGAGDEVSVKAAEKLLTEAGFTVTAVEKKLMLWYPHYTIVCFK